MYCRGQHWGHIIYINDLPKGLNSEVKLFVDDTSLFSLVNCVNTSASTFNSDLLNMQDRAYQWKMSFNPDSKITIIATLDSKLSFNEHINGKIHPANNDAGLLRKLQTVLPRNSLLTIYKSFIRPLLYCADVIYDQPSNASFAQKIESVLYNAALAITGAIKRSSREKLYQELGLDYL